MKYIIEQFPKNKDLDFSKMSIDQKALRLNPVKKKYKYGKEIKCKKCGKTQAIEEYYVKNARGRRATSCRDCQMKRSGVIEIGKLRFAFKIADKGFRRCSVCKDTKPLTEFKKNAGQYLGISNNCYDCANKLHSQFVKKQQETIGTSYIKEYGKLQGIRYFNDEIIEKLKLEILDKRKPKYFVDEKKFVTIAEFSRYIEKVYGLPITMTNKRIQEGKTEEECKLTEYEMRVLKSGSNKGQIKVTDTVTGEIFEFNNSSDIGLLKMFSTSAILRCIKTGDKTTITALSKYKNPCKIERI